MDRVTEPPLSWDRRRAALTSQLTFDEGVARQIELLYLTRDAARRRRLVKEALSARPGDQVLDVGSGPGFYCLEIADEVGPEGRVVGVDLAEPMLALARRRCESHTNVSFKKGDVLALPVEDESFHRALCVQVLEYVELATAALAEINRVLRPGGRAVIWDIDWQTVVWHSSHPALTSLILEAWDHHLAHPSLPRTLAPVCGKRALRRSNPSGMPLPRSVAATRTHTAPQSLRSSRAT